MILDSFDAREVFNFPQLPVQLMSVDGFCSYLYL